MQFFKDKGIKVVTVYPPATYTPMTTDREDMEPVPEKEAQPSDIAKAAMLVRWHVPVLAHAVLCCAIRRLCLLSSTSFALDNLLLVWLYNKHLVLLSCYSVA